MSSCPIYPILQKLFNSLKSLDSLNEKDDLIQNIANIDNFFGEFRNITFVAQKNLNTIELKKIYENNRKVYLLNERMKWFVDQRNKITKENPFDLEKDLIVYSYMPSKVSIKHFKSTLDTEIRRNTLLKKIIENLKEKSQDSYFFSIRLVFLENSKEVDIFKEIVYGVKQMIFFVRSLQKEVPCDCDRCKKLNAKISELLESIVSKEITFVWDCEFKENRLKHAERMEMYFGGKDFFEMENKIRIPLKDSLFDKDIGEKQISKNTSKLFFNFVVFHLIIYQMQKHSIMPVFMIVYSDDTFILWPFGSTIKTTFFRISNEIAQMISSKDIVSVFYAGEYYMRKGKNDANPEEMFMCSMVNNKLEEKSISFNPDEVDDMAYCKNRFAKNDKLDQQILAPIKSEFEKLSKIENK